MLHTIVSAIENREVLSFTANGVHHVVEACAVGVSKSGVHVLLCYERSRARAAAQVPEVYELSTIENPNPLGIYYSTDRTNDAFITAHLARVYIRCDHT